MGEGNSKPTFRYTLEVPNTKTPGSTSIYKSGIRADEDLIFSDAKTLHENFVEACDRFPNMRFLGSRTFCDGKHGSYSWKTYSEIRNLSKSLGFGLAYLGLAQPNSEGHSFLGIFSKNRIEWLIADFACISQSITTIPLYDVQRPETISMIINQTQMLGIFSSASLTPKLIDLKTENLIPSLKFIIQFDPVTEIIKESCETVGIKILDYKYVLELCNKGQESLPNSDSWLTICYTSGTTGNNKGAIITHKNMLAMINGVKNGALDIVPEDVYISYLPLAHMLDRAICHYLSGVGAGIGFYSGDILNLKEDLIALRPTIFVSVPRLFTRFYEGIKEMFSSAKGFKGALLRKALRAKYKALAERGEFTHAFWDKMIFNKVKSILGGRVRMLMTGSAPIPGDILTFLRIVFACPIYEGYGQTETCSGSVLTRKNETETGFVGGPVPTLEIKLIDVPDMNYMTDDVDDNNQLAPRGEICMRGQSIFIGYYKSPELTDEALDCEGWLHTGDIGVILPSNGSIKIIDRKKNFFKLAQGEYVAAEKIEMVYCKSLYVEQIFVYGNSIQSYLVAVVVPDEEYVRKKWARENGYDDDVKFEDICADLRLKDEIFKDMNRCAKEEKLLGFEFVKKIKVEAKMWTTDDLLTPTQKLMRFRAKKKYQDELDRLYLQ